MGGWGWKVRALWVLWKASGFLQQARDRPFDSASRDEA